VAKPNESTILDAIVERLDPSQRDCIRADCERYRDEFHVNVDDAVSVAEKRNRLLAVKDACLKAAEAIALCRTMICFPKAERRPLCRA
jgi:hypothetical protein